MPLDDPHDPRTSELASWLAARSDVLGVERRDDLGVLEIRYRDDVNAASRSPFVRSLRDRLHTLEHVSPSPLEVSIAHVTDGRVRFALPGAGDVDVLRLAALLRDQPGVLRADASLASRSVRVTYDAATTSARALHLATTAAPSSAWPAANVAGRSTGWARTAFGTAVLGAAMTGIAPLSVTTVAIGLTSLPAAKRAVWALRDGRLSVDVLDLAAVGISLGTGQPVTAAFITWLLSVGDLVLERAQDRACSAISQLMKLDAGEAFRLSGATSENVERVSAKGLRVGDILVVEPGGRVAADGIIVRGVASVDEKALTGEALPRHRGVGDRVLAASVVLEGQILVEIDRVGGDTTASKIVQILEGAGSKPMTLQREVEKTTDRLVLPTLALASAAGFLSAQIDRVTSVLITDFGTGIRIVVPSSALTAMTVAARAGVLVKGAQYLERLSKVDTIVFDKTGTLTSGEPRVQDVCAIGRWDAADALRLAVAAESRQAHPIAEALRMHARTLSLNVPDAELGTQVYTIGAGLSARVEGRHVLVGGARLMCQYGVDMSAAEAIRERHEAAGASSIALAIDGELAAVVGYRDEPRPESASVVRELQSGGRRRVVLMSGDSHAAVSAIATFVGADRFNAELLPEDKAALVRELQEQGRIVAMVGDGINDAPALALSDVGISLHGGTEVALETADVVLLEAGLARLPEAFAVADDAMRRIRRGIAFVIVPNALAIFLGAAGLLAPGAAALINNGSTVVASLAAVAPLLRRRAVASSGMPRA